VEAWNGCGMLRVRYDVEEEEIEVYRYCTIGRSIDQLKICCSGIEDRRIVIKEVSWNVASSVCKSMM